MDKNSRLARKERCRLQHKLEKQSYKNDECEYLRIAGRKLVPFSLQNYE